MTATGSLRFETVFEALSGPVAYEGYGGPQSRRSPLQIGRRPPNQRHVPHFPLLGGCLAVQVKVRSLDAENFLARRDMSDDVEHHRCSAQRRRAERQREHRAQMILELAGLRAPDCPWSE